MVQICAEAFALLDLTKAEACSHPRTGAVDHVAVHPLPRPGTGGCDEAAEREESLAAAANLARSIGRLVSALPGSGAVAATPARDFTPVYLYGAAAESKASSGGRGLAELRRELGFFAGASTGTWHGPSGMAVTTQTRDPRQQMLPLPDFWGGDRAPSAEHGVGALFGLQEPRRGVVCIGATKLVLNVNILLRGCSDLALGRSIARAVSARGGGLPSVQTMALLHAAPDPSTNAAATATTGASDGCEEAMEIACNLLDPNTPGSTSDDVVRCVVELALAAGLPAPELAHDVYSTGKSETELVELIQQRQQQSNALPQCI